MHCHLTPFACFPASLSATLINATSQEYPIKRFPDSESVNRAAVVCAAVMLCFVRAGAMGRAGVEFPGPTRPKGTTWLCLECLCLSSVSGFTCAVSVTTTLSLSATRRDIQYGSAGTWPIGNLWLSPVGAVVKCGSMFYLETFGEVMSWWTKFIHFEL